IPFAQRFRIGGFPLIPDPARQRPQVQQFVYMATSRGLTAGEAALVGNTRAGVFTEALVGGLQGDGEAKLYNINARAYDIGANRLLQYLVNQVRTQIADLTLPNAADPGGFLQTPTLSGEFFSDPVIVSIPRDSVKPVVLELDVTPNGACQFTKVIV